MRPKPRETVRIKRSNVHGEAGLYGTVQAGLLGGTAQERGAAGPYVFVLLPAPYGAVYAHVDDLEPVDFKKLEVVAVKGRFGVVIGRTKTSVRVQFEYSVEWVDPGDVELSTPEEVLVNDVMTR
jgi:hypothetical protein